MLTKLFSFFTLFSLFWIPQFGFGQKAATTAAEKGDQPLENSLLWEIKGKGLKKASYLFGTIHIISEKDFFLPKPLVKRLKKSKKLVMEVDLKSEMLMMLSARNTSVMQDGKTLSDFLTPEEHTELKNYFLQNVPEVAMTGFDMYETFKPYFITSLLYSRMIDGPPKMYEFELNNIASDEDIATGGLETMAFQMSVFDSIPYDQQARELLEMVRSLKNGEGQQEFARMVEIYKTQAVDELYSSSMSKDNFKSQEDILLTRRNKDWIPKISQIVHEQPTFFAVGAAHLGGPNGVIRLLRAAGYTVTAVMK